ncbi:MAG: NmrA family NAD(P)-binding protein [Rhodospirillales bacterium]|nr:NmrA family NAD(P)-binding protein [Rhodospirillales bacterium]
MIKPRIVVTGATGKIGGAVAAQLLADGWPVRALVRRSDDRSAALAKAGAEVVAVDPNDPQQLAEAIRGTERAFYLPPTDPHMLHGAIAFAIAAKDARLEQVVVLSQWLANPAHPSLCTRQHWMVDRIIATLTGIAYTIVNPGFFADNYLRLTPFAAHLGVYPSLSVDALNAPPSNEDIARVAVAALKEPAAHVGKSYRPTGPELLSEAQMIAIIARAVGRRVIRLPMPRWMVVRAMRADGISPFQVSEILTYFEDAKRGAFALGAPNDDVRRVTGRAAEDFETTARRYAARAEADGRSRISGVSLRSST